MIVPGSANSLLLGQAAASTGYNLTKSLRTRASASAYLNRTPASAGNRQKFTWSGWVKRGTLGTLGALFSGGTTSGDTTCFVIQFGGGDTFVISSDLTAWRVTNQVFRDPSAWYHIVVSVDTTQATADNRILLYVNGLQVTSFSTNAAITQNSNTGINSTESQNIGRRGISTDRYFDGYMAEVNFVDGQQLTPSSFGANDATTGVWQPIKYTGTYGTNGFYLPFTNNASATPAGLGQDLSGTSSTAIVGSSTNGSTTLSVVSLTGISIGNIVTGPGIPSNTYVTATGVLSVTLSQAATSTNASVSYTFSGNNWFCNNISVTAGSTYDSMTDVPTLTSATTANYCVLNPITNYSASIGIVQYANLGWSQTGTAAYGKVVGTMAMSGSGKYYWEATMVSANLAEVGIISASDQSVYYPGYSPNGYVYYTNGQKGNNNSYVSYGASFTAGDVLGIAFDASAGTLTFYKNGTTQGTAYTGLTGTYLPAFGNDSSNGSNITNLTVNFGQQPFAYTPPTGYVALNTYNLPTSTIVAGNKYMDATLYTGNSSTNNIVNASGFKPDLVWTKDRSAANNHMLGDSVRGTNNTLFSNLTVAAFTDRGVDSFNSNGFTYSGTEGGDGNVSGNSYVAWQWQAGQGTTSSNTSGSITSTVSVNPTAGFSIATFTSPSGGAAAYTVGHGLGIAPSLVISKERNASGIWSVYHVSTGDGRLQLQSTAAVTTGVFTTAPTSSTIWFPSSYADGSQRVAYCWAEIAGFSKFGSYTGNGSTDGPFIYTGFRPKYILIKNTGSISGYGDWYVWDSVRNTYNIAGSTLRPNTSDQEYTNNTAYAIDLVSNGVKIRTTYNDMNASGYTYIYAAFAENPTKFALAR